MKRFVEFMAVGFSVLFVSTNLSIAQSEPPPPPCCGGKAASIETEVQLQSSGFTLSKFEVSEGMLISLGMTRGQFLERLSQSLLPGRVLNRVIYSTRFMNRPIIDSRRAGSTDGDPMSLEEGLIAVEQRRLYQIPREQLQAEKLASLDEIYLSDGEIYIRVLFTKAE
jgi:hypothetical protein